MRELSLLRVQLKMLTVASLRTAPPFRSALFSLNVLCVKVRVAPFQMAPPFLRG